MAGFSTRLAIGTGLLWLGVRWRSRSTRNSELLPATPVAASVEEQREILGILIDHARGLISRQSGDSDALDTKAVGLIAVALAGITLLVATHDALNDLWWVPVLLLGIASVPMLWVLWPRFFDTGPGPTEFYDRFGTTPARDAERQMLAELALSFDRNQPGLAREHTAFKFGFALVLLAVAVSVPTAVFPEEDVKPDPAPATTGPASTLKTTTLPTVTVTTTNIGG